MDCRKVVLTEGRGGGGGGFLLFHAGRESRMSASRISSQGLKYNLPVVDAMHEPTHGVGESAAHFVAVRLARGPIRWALRLGGCRVCLRLCARREVPTSAAAMTVMGQALLCTCSFLGSLPSGSVPAQERVKNGSRWIKLCAHTTARTFYSMASIREVLFQVWRAVSLAVCTYMFLERRLCRIARAE